MSAVTKKHPKPKRDRRPIGSFPRWVLFAKAGPDSELSIWAAMSGIAKALLGGLCSMAVEVDYYVSRCTASHATIGRKSGVTGRASVVKGLKELENWGVIGIRPGHEAESGQRGGRGYANHYEIFMEERPPENEADGPDKCSIGDTLSRRWHLHKGGVTTPLDPTDKALNQVAESAQILTQSVHSAIDKCSKISTPSSVLPSELPSPPEEGEVASCASRLKEYGLAPMNAAKLVSAYPDLTPPAIDLLWRESEGKRSRVGWLYSVAIANPAKVQAAIERAAGAAADAGERERAAAALTACETLLRQNGVELLDDWCGYDFTSLVAIIVQHTGISAQAVSDELKGMTDGQFRRLMNGARNHRLAIDEALSLP